MNTDKRILSFTAFALLLAGIFLPLLAMLVPNPAGGPIIFANIALVLALIFGILSWSYLLSRVAVIGALVVCVIGAINYIRFRSHADEARRSMEQMEQEWDQRNP